MKNKTFKVRRTSIQGVDEGRKIDYHGRCLNIAWFIWERLLNFNFNQSTNNQCTRTAFPGIKKNLFKLIVLFHFWRHCLDKEMQVGLMSNVVCRVLRNGDKTTIFLWTFWFVDWLKLEVNNLSHINHVMSKHLPWWSIFDIYLLSIMLFW